MVIASVYGSREVVRFLLVAQCILELASIITLYYWLTKRIRWVCPNMTENLLTVAFNHKNTESMDAVSLARESGE